MPKTDEVVDMVLDAVISGEMSGPRASDIKDRPTLVENLKHDLKIQTENYRVWLERNAGNIVIEKAFGSTWTKVLEYDGANP